MTIGESRRLTLNLGLRWELETPLTERQNKSVSGFDFAYVQPIQGTVQTRYAALNDPTLKNLSPQISVTGGLMFVGVDDGNAYNTPKGTFLPRFGVAYQINDKTVFRGGFGCSLASSGERRGDVIQPGSLGPPPRFHHDKRQWRSDFLSTLSNRFR